MSIRELLNGDFFWDGYSHVFKAQGIPTPHKNLFLDFAEDKVGALLKELGDPTALRLPLRIKSFFGDRDRLDLQGAIVTDTQTLWYRGRAVWMPKLGKFRGVVSLVTDADDDPNDQWTELPRAIEAARFVEYNGHAMIEGWPERIEQAQLEIDYAVNGRKYARVPYGDLREEWSNRPPESCGDCGVLEQQLHVPGCDLERCPACFGQAISCECRYGEAPDA